MTTLCVVLTSCPPDRADAIAAHLIDGHFAACVSVVPGAVSTYRWQGQLQRETEALLLVKVPQPSLERCLAALTAVHPYAVPELVVLAAQDVNASYLAWAMAMTAVEPIAALSGAKPKRRRGRTTKAPQ